MIPRGLKKLVLPSPGLSAGRYSRSSSAEAKQNQLTDPREPKIISRDEGVVGDRQNTVSRLEQ